MCGHPAPFRSVRDLGRVPARCSWPSGIPERRSPRWLPAWLPVVEDLAARLAFGTCGDRLESRSARLRADYADVRKIPDFTWGLSVERVTGIEPPTISLGICAIRAFYMA